MIYYVMYIIVLYMYMHFTNRRNFVRICVMCVIRTVQITSKYPRFIYSYCSLVVILFQPCASYCFRISFYHLMSLVIHVSVNVSLIIRVCVNVYLNLFSSISIYMYIPTYLVSGVTQICLMFKNLLYFIIIDYLILKDSQK